MSIEEDFSHLVLNMPPKEIDLSQSPSMDFGRSQAGADEHIRKFRDVLADVLHGLTQATQETFEKYDAHFNKKIDALTNTIQEALTDIDQRLNLLSQETGRTQTVLDSFLKLWMLGDSGPDMSEHKAIISDFLRSGMQQPQLPESIGGTPFDEQPKEATNAN